MQRRPCLNQRHNHLADMWCQFGQRASAMVRHGYLVSEFCTGAYGFAQLDVFVTGLLRMRDFLGCLGS